MANPNPPSERVIEYWRTQTAGLFATAVLLVLMEWGKPGIVSHVLPIGLVLLALVGSATITALLLPVGQRAQALPWRGVTAVGLGLLVGLGLAATASPTLGWLAGLTVGCSVAVTGRGPRHD